MADTVATAYVTIEPTMKGVAGKLKSELGDASDSAGKSAGKSFGSGFGSVIGGTAKVMAGAVAAGATAATGVVKSATQNFAQFEQLAGGAELLFGSASESVMKNAETAFQRVQMSTNDYLQTANSFATGLKESLGGDSQAAADLADKIIVAQADVVAATGNNAENVANAFAGIMKNNFTMLDNLQLGIKPTKEGMQEVIDKMNELNGTKYEMGNLADMQSAIVDYIDYVGMAGYAQNEASETIEGSLATLKASWDNLLTGMGDKNADLSGLIDGLVGSAETVVGNLLPIIEQALTGVSTLIAELAPVIAEKIPGLLQTVLPMLLTSGVQIVQTLGQGILAAIPELMPTITDLILQLGTMLVEMLPQLIEVGMQVILQLALGISQALPELVPTIVEVVLSIVMYLLDNIDLLIDAAVQLMIGLAVGLVNAIPILIEKVPIIIYQLFDAIISLKLKLAEAGIQLLTAMKDAFVQKFPEMVQKAQALIGELKTRLIESVKKFTEIGTRIVEGIKQGISNAWGAFKDWVLGLLGGLVDGIKDFFNIGSPSKLMADEIGQWIPAGIAEGIESGMGVLNNAMNAMDTDILVGAQVTAGNIPKYTAEAMDGADGSLYQLLATYLPQIAQGGNVQISLEGDAGRLFRMMQRESVRNTQLVGVDSVLSAI